MFKHDRWIVNSGILSKVKIVFAQSSCIIKSLSLVEEKGIFYFFSRMFIRKHTQSKNILYGNVWSLATAGFVVKCTETTKSAGRHFPFYVAL
jgi:hypothetical protein